MKIESIYINNYKSLVDFKLEKPNPFTVFFGANGTGKSNIFEALDFQNHLISTPLVSAGNLFGNKNHILNFSASSLYIRYKLDYCKNKNNQSSNTLESNVKFSEIKNGIVSGSNGYLNPDSSLEKIFTTDELETFKAIYENKTKAFKNFQRIFINNPNLPHIPVNSDDRLNIDGKNLEKVLKRILKDEEIKDEFVETLQLFLPEFNNIEVRSDNIAGTDSLLIYEKNSNRPFNRNLISDGTFNILCLLTALYQKKEPQFLCIEEPENGLNPKVVKEFVQLCRSFCEEGHYIWLNTHSQTLVSQLSPKEAILVDKKDGKTVITQFPDTHGMKMDEAWLSNTLGGGLPW